MAPVEHLGSVFLDAAGDDAERQDGVDVGVEPFLGGAGAGERVAVSALDGARGDDEQVVLHGASFLR